MKIDYSEIRWDASTNWEFCGTFQNLRVVWERYNKYFGSDEPIEEFAYKKPRRSLAFDTGDVVLFTDTRGSGRAVKVVKQYAVVSRPCDKYAALHVRIADGSVFMVCSNEIPERVSIADIPEELMALARAEAGKPMDFSKCPLRKPACMETK